MVEIRLRNDVLTITSPGGLWGVTESQLGHPGAKSAVNPVLYQICKNTRGSDGIRVIEGEGGGIIEAVNVLRAAHLRTPRFIDKGIAFTVLISRHTLLNNEQLEWIQNQEVQPEASSEALAVLASMREGNEWNKARIRSHFSLSPDEAGRILDQVRAHPEVLAKGQGRARVYYMAVSPTATEQPMTKNGPLVLDALDRGPLMAREITAMTALSPRAVQYALNFLMEHDLVEMIGGQGDPKTRYGKKQH
nr:ATP-binding protein [Corynebacterium sp. 76QC2CO]